MAPYVVVHSALDGPWCRGSVLPHHGRHTWQASPTVATMGLLGGFYNQGGGSRKLGVRAPTGRSPLTCASWIAGDVTIPGKPGEDRSMVQCNERRRVDDG